MKDTKFKNESLNSNNDVKTTNRGSEVSTSKTKRLAVSLLAGALTLALVITGCLLTNTSTDSAKEEAVSTSVSASKSTYKATEDDLKDFVAGLDDAYVVENAEDFDLLKTVVIDKTAIKAISLDDSKVDYKKTGTYPITYTIKVKNSKVSEGEDGYTILKVNKTLNVVTADEAKKLADEGKVVYQSKNEVVKKTDGTVVETEKPAVNNAEVATKAPTVKKEESTSSNKTSSNTTTSKPSTNTSKPTTNTSKPTTNTSKPAAHTHNWQPVYKTVVTKVAWDETVVVKAAYYDEVEVVQVICNGCHQNIKSYSHAERTMHLLECGPGSYHTETVIERGAYHPAQTKVVHHNATTQQVVDYYKCSCGATK